MSDRLVRALADVVDVQPPHDFTWLGRHVAGLDARLRPLLTRGQARAHLVASLRFQLYHGFYCTGAIVHSPPGPVGERDPGAFIDALSAANCGTGRWQAGWTVRVVRERTLAATRDGLTVEARLDECRPCGGPLVPGEAVALRLPKEADRRSIGFYMSVGDKELEPDGPGSVVRVYWHLRSDGAPRLVRLTTSLLNRGGVPFLLKVVDHPGRYLRCDAGVLYLRALDWREVAPTVARIHDALRDALREPTPPFTRRLAPGLAVAEDPPGGDSFGMHRCGLVADGFVLAAERDAVGVEPRVLAVRERFAAEGVDLDRPYLGRGSDADYTLPRPRRATARAQRDLRDAVHPDLAMRWREAAAQIAADLCTHAFWHSGRCSWVGADASTAADSPGGLTAAACSGLGPEVYAGTAGVALFLADLAARTGDDEARRTAAGAARHALRHAARVPPSHRLGLYTGALGIALAAARVGVLLGEDDLVAAAGALARACLRDRPPERELDLLGGDAGGVLALLGLADILDDPSLRDGAVAVGDEMLAAAVRDGDALCWPSRSWAGTPSLCGLSHGAAGSALALVELHRLTGHPRWRDAAFAAFAYERRWFDPRAANWRDLRPLPANAPFMTAWCHGAPGIALSRLYAAEVLGDRRLRDEAETALRTTRQAVETTLRYGVDDFSLCHGLAGNADVLLVAARLSDDGGADPLASSVGQFGVDVYAHRGTHWPCGTPTGESPGLMLGLAGIGSFYLRLADATVPSALWLLPAELRRAPAGAPAIVDVPAPVQPIVPALTLTLDRERLATIVHRGLRARGFTVDGEQYSAASATRWPLGVALRDRALADRLPAFSDPIDYLSVADTDPQLWNSLPLMLAFGHEQAKVLGAIAGLDGRASVEVAILGAVFSTLLSVFDHAVDDRPYREAVFGLEPSAVTGLFGAERAADETLALTYGATGDLPVRLVCVLFAVLGHLLREQTGRAGARAIAELEVVTRRLFAAERASTLGTATTLAELRALATASRTKSVLPFVTLAHMLTLDAPDTHRASTVEAAAALGRCIGLADDLVDLLDDLHAAAPSPLVLAVAERAAARGATTATDEDVAEVAERATAELADALAPERFAPSEGDGTVDSVVAFARLSVARWVGWREPESTRCPPAGPLVGVTT